MKAKRHPALPVGTRVAWTDPEGVEFATEEIRQAYFGEVIESDYASFMVRWDDGVQCAYRNSFVDHIHIMK